MNQKSKTKWEEGFWDEFPKPHGCLDDNCMEERKEIISFITSLLKEKEEEINEKTKIDVMKLTNRMRKNWQRGQKEKEEETEKMVKKMVGEKKIATPKDHSWSEGLSMPYGYNQKREEVKKIASNFNYKI